MAAHIQTAGDLSSSVEDFEGERYSLVFFSISQYARVPMDQRALLLDYPTTESMRVLQKMLAPPRGYNDGMRQRSIQEAFGLAGKSQSMRWQPAVEWGKLPLDVLLRISRFAGDAGMIRALCKGVL